MHCIYCNAVVPEGARYCPGCGKRIEPFRGTYHTVTILYVDLSGYTRLVRSRPPEDIASLMQTFFSLVEEVVEEAGGTVYQKLGDGALCVFGYPRVLEGVPVRALHACMELKKRLRTQSREDVQIHGGVATGKVLVASGDELRFFGEPMNLAARLEHHARAGEILMDRETFLLASRAFNLTYRGSLPLKGFGERDVYRLEGLKEVQEWEQDREVNVFVGREVEIGLLQEAWSRFQRKPEPLLIRIQGEAGIGKTRLLAEFLSTIPRDRVLVARALPFGMPPYGPLLYAWSNRETHSQETHATRLLLPYPELVGGAHDINAYYRMDQDVLRRALIQQFRALIPQVQIIVLDDAHWADAGTFDVLRQLYLEHIPVMLIISARPPHPGGSVWADTLLKMEREIPSRVLRLFPFTEKETRLFVEMLNPELQGKSVVQEIVSRTGGIPLFIEEMVSSIPASMSDSAPAIPGRVEEVLRSRISQFPERSQELLECASLVGPFFFDVPVYRALGISKDLFLHHLRPLLQHRMVLEEPDVRPGAWNAYSFRHTLIYETVFSSVPSDRRRHLAHALLEVFLKTEETLPGLSRNQILARLAWFASRDSLAETFVLKVLESHTRKGAWRQILHFLSFFEGMEERFSSEALEKIWNYRIRAHLRTGEHGIALAMMEKRKPRTGDLTDYHFLEAEIRRREGDYPGALDVLSRIPDGEAETQRRKYMEMVKILHILGDQERVDELWEKLSLIPVSNDPWDQVELLMLRANTLPYLQLKKRNRLYREVLDMAERYELSDHVRRASRMLIYLAERGYIADALRYQERALESARRVDDVEAMVGALYFLAQIHAEVGALEMAEAYLEQQNNLLNSFPHPDGWLYSHWLRAYLASLRGDVETQDHALREASRLAWQLGSKENRAVLLDDYAHFLMEQGKRAGIAVARLVWSRWDPYRKHLFEWRWGLEDMPGEVVLAMLPTHLPWAEWLEILMWMMEKEPRLKPRLLWKAKKIYNFVLSHTPEHLQPFFLQHPQYGVFSSGVV